MLQLILFWLSVATGANIGNLKDFALTWPSQYSLEATRISLTSGITEDYKIWRTNDSSRIDYNGGAVKLIVTKSLEDYPFGVKYDIHPETTNDEFNKIKCNLVNGSEYEQLEPEDILPSTDYSNYTLVAHEPINDEETIKFFLKDTDESTDSRKTVWAVYDDDHELWIPVRYELIEYNSWLGSLAKHEIWDYYNFEPEVDDSAFNTDDYNCEEVYLSVEQLNSESVTKHLLFMSPENEKHVDLVFNAFQQKFNRKYAHEDEYAMRRSIFQHNMRLIATRNRQNLGYKLGVNQFADRTPEEMKKHQGLRRRAAGKVGTVPFPYTESKLKDIVNELPLDYDARILGLVSKVKNQEDCGSCWTFGTTAAVEGALARINGGKLMSLSNQALIDCAWPYGGSGCDGGSDNAAYEWMMKYGLPTEAEYGPYRNTDNLCLIKNMTVTYPIRGYTDVTPYSVGALKVALVNHGPLSVSVHASDAFTLYSGGVFYDPDCSSIALDHEVTLVGYGERDDDTFWILKNSWGPSWGSEGYMLISARDNNCGVATEPTYVVF